TDEPARTPRSDERSDNDRRDTRSDEERSGSERSDGETRAPRFLAGDRVAARYRVTRLIASGGMGEVYEPEDLELGGRAALKTILAGGADPDHALERFKREIQLARKVTHPNVCRIFDLGVHPRAPKSPLSFLTMELLAGETLAARLARGRLTTDEARP